ncbi:hypothetical protein PQ455_12085 [Sphingomonas naphthae]|uniref:DUF768 domain-containing protein n=1 Tax=Sphingomonas naphthae TaxID=1813468 RepID=A0ABY7THF8_9SPHN|nr:hypothetical protein [Sphingomonas naphthae]WCT72375.1 hypothetical protein PQ455_12085 [Sphingomonas naphthae]
MSRASDFLEAWTVARTDTRALTTEEAGTIADQWEGEAIENGVDPDDLGTAAGGDLRAYLLRTYGEVGQEVSTDDGDHSDAQKPPPQPRHREPGVF